MDPKEHREQVIKDAKCQLILNAAHKIFAEKGYWTARLEDIAADVGFSKASLYNYYPDKESIFLSLTIREISGIIEKIEEAAQQEKSFFDSIDTILRIMFSHFKEHFAFVVNISNFDNMMNLHRDMGRHPELFQEFHGLMKRITSSICAVVERGKAKKEIAAAHDPAMLAQFIASMVQSLQMLSLKIGKPIETDEAIGRLMDFIKHGVGTGKEQ
jgi:AcrR family transcriptional regulator